MYKEQFELQEKGIKSKGKLTSNIFLNFEDNLSAYHYLYHFIKEKSEHLVPYYKYKFNQKHVRNIIDIYHKMRTNDLGIIILSHESKTPELIMNDLLIKCEDVIYEDRIIHPIQMMDSVVIYVHHLEDNLTKLLEFSDHEYQMTIITRSYIYVYSNHELIHEREFKCKNDYYMLSQLWDYQIHEIAISKIIYDAFEKNPMKRKQIIEQLDSTFFKTIKLFFSPLYQPNMLLTTRYKNISKVHIIHNLFNQPDYMKFMDLTYDMYVVFHQKGEIY